MFLGTAWFRRFNGTIPALHKCQRSTSPPCFQPLWSKCRALHSARPAPFPPNQRLLPDGSVSKRCKQAFIWARHRFRFILLSSVIWRFSFPLQIVYVFHSLLFDRESLLGFLPFVFPLFFHVEKTANVGFANCCQYGICAAAAANL